MTFEERINDEIKSAMKSGNKHRLETLRSIRSAILEFKKSGKDKELTDDEATKLLNKAAKSRKDSIGMYLQAGRTELAEREKKELRIIEEFLPEQLSEEELNKIILAMIEKLDADGMKDMGKVMSAIMNEVGPRADGSTVQQIVRKLLSEN